MRYHADGQPLPEYTASLQSKKREARMTWGKIVRPGEDRKPAQLDLDVGVSLARQWAQQQADARRDGEGVLECAANAHMDWQGRLAPGASGVRLLVLTLLCWGAELNENALSERAEWNMLARDFADVLNILAAQAGPYQAPATVPSTAQGVPEKRVK